MESMRPQSLSTAALLPRVFSLPRPRWLLFILATLGAGIHPLASQTRAQAAPAMPDTVEGFAMREIKVYEQAERGTLYRYVRSEDKVIDVFVYPANDSTAPAALPISGLLDRETEVFKSAITIGLQRGLYDAVEPAYEKHDTVGSVIGREVAMAVRRGGEARVSYFYLYVHQGNFIKVRSTVPVPVFREGTVPSFVRSLVTQLTQPSLRAQKVPSGTSP